MWDWINSASYVAHGYCLLWQPWLVALYAGSDALIFIAYAAIPIALLRFIRLRPDIGYRHLIALFAAFILLCGLTHLISMVTLWYPAYGLHAAVKLATAIVSLTTAAVLFPLVPVLARIPSPADLQTANARLRAEIAAHEQTLSALRASRDELEHRVAERTSELRAANERLTTASQEAAHRSKNLLTVVQSLARQTARGAKDKADLMDRLAGRLTALGTAIDTVLPGQQGGSADMREVAERQLAGHLDTFAGRIALDGRPLALAPDAAQQLALALHELATNALKYGALSKPVGQVAISWGRDGAGRAWLDWRETGATPTRPPAAAGGFGTALLTKAIPAQLDGSATMAIEGGELHYRLDFPDLPA